MHYDALIIGAGLSGLAAGIRLALCGKKVRIFEKHSIPGGLNSYYDRGGAHFNVGLHAITNYVPENQRSAALNKILRQLRIKREALQLRRQLTSEIVFPGAKLRLENDFESFRDEIRNAFPTQLEGFDRLVKNLPEYESCTEKEDRISARQILQQYITVPLLREMLLCPVMFYGNPLPRDMSYAQFALIFRSVIMEGMARPYGGMKAVIQLLVSRLEALGGELSLKNGIASIQCKDGMVQSVTDEKGAIHTADIYISNAGAQETDSLCTGERAIQPSMRQGEMSFIELIFAMDCKASSLGIGQSIIFRSTRENFFFDIPEGDIDCQSHIVCLPGNFEDCSSLDDAFQMRISVPASARRWLGKGKAEYAESKQNAASEIEKLATGIFPQIKGHIIRHELFTPKTIQRFTGHINGAIYGSPDKLRDGKTLLENLRICGTDQGLLGIVGSLTSGIVTANSCVLNG